MSARFSAAQLAALANPFDAVAEPAEACHWHTPAGTSGWLTCDIYDVTAASFGGPVWHASVSPPVRAYARALIATVGEGLLFDKPDERPDIFHLRRRMTAAEVERLGGFRP